MGYQNHQQKAAQGRALHNYKLTWELHISVVRSYSYMIHHDPPARPEPFNRIMKHSNVYIQSFTCYCFMPFSDRF